ncbi:MAG: ATP-binding protein [Acidimicrobiia bacterium]
MIHLAAVVDRRANSLVDTLVAEEPAILIEGPRGSGKSTILRSVVERVGGALVDLDDAATLAQIQAGSASVLESPRLVAIDEFQRAPEVLLTVKRIVDREGGAGRFLVAGSVSDRLLPRGTETLTGRVHRLTLMPLSAGETLGELTPWLPAALDADIPAVYSALGRDAVFELVAAGGYPGALRRPTTALQRRWLSSYLSSVADRDLPSLVDVRHPGSLGRLYRLVAQRTAATANVAELATRLGTTPHTARLYLGLLDRVFLVRELPSWSAGMSAREGRRSKLHVTDTGLAAVAVNMDAGKLRRHAIGGTFVETFVHNELVKQLSLLDEPVTLGHYRDRHGSEVDLIVERGDGSVLAIEVKASIDVGVRDTKSLGALRDHLGDRFIAGVVFHTGPLTVRLDDRIWATPISALWGGGGQVAVGALDATP